MTTRNEDGSQGYCGFVVGQHVVCVDDSDGTVGLDKKIELVKGRVYTVHDINAVDFSAVAIQVVECEKTYEQEDGVYEGWFGHWRFRPLAKLKVEDFLSTKTPVDGERVPA